MTSPRLGYSLVDSPDLGRAIARLALPALMEELLMLSVGWTDWWLTCQFMEGTDPRAAMALMSYVMWTLTSLFAAVAIGATAMVARFVGSRDQSAARWVTNQALVAGAVLALCIFTTVYLSATHFPRWLQLPPAAAELATQYIQIVLFAIPFIMVEQVGAACLRGAGDTVTGFVAKLVVVIVNIIVSAGLILGWGPLPQLGWVSLAIGTAVGHGIGGTIIAIRLGSGGAGLGLRLSLMKPSIQLLTRLLSIGMPGGFDMVALLSCQFAFVGIINRLGSAAAAAHGLAVQIEALAYLPGSAFQVAAATVAGQFLGAMHPDRASRGAWHCLLMGGGIMCAAGSVFFFGGHLLTSFFTGDASDPTAQVSAGLLKIVAFSMPSLAIVMILTGALRGAGDTRWPLVITLIGFVAVRLPLAFWLAYDTVELPVVDVAFPGWNLGVRGAWYAMLIDLVVRSILVGWRFVQGRWREVLI